MLIKNRDPDQQKKAAVLRWIAVGMATHGIKTYKELSRLTGITENQLCYRRTHPESMRKCEEWALERVIGAMEQ